VKDWATELLSKERERVKAFDIIPVEVPVLEMRVILQGKKTQINRVIFDTEYDFSEVQQILISPSTPCPFKAGF